MGVGGRRKTFFHGKKSFSPLPEPLSTFQKKRGICWGKSGGDEKSGVFVEGKSGFVEGKAGFVGNFMIEKEVFL